MALTRIDNPTPSAPAALADYVQILAVQMNSILQALRNNSHACIDFANNFAREGVVFYLGGVLYKAVTDQAIGGTPSKYVKITPSGATAAIDYVASLSGVSWNDAQSGYYDVSGNLYIFDEARAVYDGVVSSGKTIEGQIAYIAGALSVKGNLTSPRAILTQATGTAPLTVSSTTKVTNLNADLLDGLDSTDFQPHFETGSTTSTTPGEVASLIEGVGGAQVTETYLVVATPNSSFESDVHIAYVILKVSDSTSSASIVNVQTGGNLISTDETNVLGVRKRRILVKALTGGQVTKYSVVPLGQSV